MRGKKKTHEEYVVELAINNPDIEVIEQYIDANTPIMHHCKKHDVYWKAKPSNVRRGRGCKECKKEKYRNSVAKSHEEYVRQVGEVNPDIEVLEQYVDGHTPILHHCKKHYIKWMAIPGNILRGGGCLNCGKEKIGNGLRKTHEQYVNELAKINPNIEVIGLYTGSMIKTLHRCKIDGFEWYAIPNSIIQGNGCPECKRREQSKRRTKTHSQYVQEVAEINPNIEVIGEYIGDGVPILHRCKIDGHEWMARPGNILQGQGCPKCNMSKGEKTIANWLNKNNISYEQQKTFDGCRNKLPLPFDFYLTDYNIAIEYNGKQHYEPVDYFGGEEAFKNVVLRDKIKENYCSENNIHLIKIAYNTNIYEELQKLYELLTLSEIA